MTNEQIIAKMAILAGLYTEDEVIDFLKEGKEIPLHTLNGWTARGNYKIKAGEHGLETRLWKKKEKKDNRNGSEEYKEKFYLTKAFLFSLDQVELKEEL